MNIPGMIVNMNIPDIIIVDSSKLVGKYKEHMDILTLHELELSEFIERIVAALEHKDIAAERLLEFIIEVKEEYKDLFSEEELKLFGAILFYLGTELFQHFKDMGVYLPDTDALPYYFDRMSGNDIILKFDYLEENGGSSLC